MRSFFLITLILFLLSCGSTAELENFDKESWVKDEGGCSSLRSQQIPILLDQKEKIKGLTDREVISMLGEPDETNLYQRTQRFFVYYTSPGPECSEDNLDPSRLEIRISALNSVNEVTHYP